ncbi:DEAD/DEAH box helicase family protein [Candidatus Woesearchaeota archaeon]|nr:DEAD/DEAH box helicase family protein [Candidatus Woesearchaeota archaeon]
MIKDFQPRLYQETILNTSISKNTLVVLPTGMGKTSSAFLLAAHRLKQYPNSKILVLACTKPLVDQHYETFRRHLDIDEGRIILLTGQISPEKRQEIWKNAQVIIATPQAIENDMIAGNVPIEDISLLVVDEAHRATGNYSYCYVSKKYIKHARYPRILALTASPGSDMDKIKEVCQNLFIEAVEVRTDKDPDVSPYIHEIVMEWVKVELPPIFLDVKKLLSTFLDSRLEKLKGLGILKVNDTSYITKKDLLGLQGQLRGSIANGDKDFNAMTAISVIAELMKVYHALELLETQGVPALHKYFGKLMEESVSTKTKAIKNIVSDYNFKSAFVKVHALNEKGIEHPKLIELQKIVDGEMKKDSGTKLIVFNQYRDNALDITKKLNSINGVSARMFVGQQKKGETGLSQKEQKQMMDDFRKGLFNVLVATSIGEEGLDVPQVDIVIFYEPLPSAIRHIQRRGRTGRHEKGRVIILMAKNTRDESYKWSAFHKEKRMHSNLEKIKQNFAFASTPKPALNLNSFAQNSIIIYADPREKSSNVIRSLADTDNIVIKLKTLNSADYVLSERVGVEFKTVGDFVDSIFDGRLLQQIKDLKNNFERPIIVIEGEQDIFSVRNIHPNAIRGMLATIAVSYGIPVLQTKNAKETSALFGIIASREQEAGGSNFSPHADRKPLTLKEQQEYLVSALPGVGLTLSKPLLKRFKSIKNLVNASVYELQEVEKIGEVKAKQIKDVVEGEYKGE